MIDTIKDFAQESDGSRGRSSRWSRSRSMGSYVDLSLAVVVVLAMDSLLPIGQKAKLLVSQSDVGISDVRNALEIIAIASRAAFGSVATRSMTIALATASPSTTGCVDLSARWLLPWRPSPACTLKPPPN